MAKPRRNTPRPAAGYYAYWIHQLQHALALPPVRANDLVRAAIHAAPPDCHPPMADAWLFDVATDRGEALDGLHAIGWLRLRRALGDDAGVMDPEAARYGYWQLGIPPRFGGSRWVRTCREVARDAERLGFGLSPRRVTAFRDHPAWTRPYLRCATFKAWIEAGMDSSLAEPPPPAPWPISGGARARALSVSPLQS